MTATFYIGDAVTVMNTLPEKSVDLILTSPPFLALRSYLPQDHPDKALEGGSQSTPGQYIDWLLDVVEACARVLARHGSLCFELGDTYSGGGQGPDARYEAKANQVLYSPTKRGLHSNGHWPLDKSLSLIPETFRFAMVYGRNPHTGRTTPPWRLRNVIRWVRPNPPVGALGDKFRPATSELMVFCKAKDRYFDLDAVRTPTETMGEEYRPGRKPIDDKNPSHGWGDAPQRIENPAGAPPLDWWNIPPGGYPGAHYAVWPSELLVKPIKAMCPEKFCRMCGEASRRITEVAYVKLQATNNATARGTTDGVLSGADPTFIHGRADKTVDTVGFTDCGHNDWRPGLVLDPFAGSGTTLAVATGHGRNAIGIDIDARNFDLALDRVGPLVLTQGEVAA